MTGAASCGELGNKRNKHWAERHQIYTVCQETNISSCSNPDRGYIKQSATSNNGQVSAAHNPLKELGRLRYLGMVYKTNEYL